MVEYYNRSRGIGVFPKHWRGLEPGQDSEYRAARIIANMMADREARGDHRGAEEIRSAFINGQRSGFAPSIDELRERWLRDGTAASALALAKALAG